ncbi:NAD(P)-dependent oxidoreductase [Novosphingobium sp. 9U]|uniref:NAD(P)-dependent oxidoreductase n=1 Tax=Novosphingobium sp. 9U TaxID=2653158 RepID=UPI0012EF2A05|nr:NAD(P)-dependent oxidoreductase [Novosphingobium sp. 9U]VWX49693.1 6-phosphogluconate dehydrogenase [Novosphingobium sp. 9U]
MDVGFVGLGQMGHAIAANLVSAGHQVSLWNRSPDKADDLVSQGARLARCPADTAPGGVVFTMLADDAALEAVSFGEGGLLSAAEPVLHVSLSTISPTLAKRLDEAHRNAGGRFVSAPVFGRPDAAAARKLFVVAAGASEDIAQVQPLFDAIGQRTFTVGEEPAQANVVKLCGNFMIMASIESMAEAMTLGVKNGIERATLNEVLTETLFGGLVHRNYGKMLVEEAFRPAGFAAPLGLKDMRLVKNAAEEARVPMPVLGVVHDHLLSTIAREGEDIDWSGIARIVAADAGL